MGFGSTAKKLQKVADMAEDVYGRLNELRQQVVETQETVVETRDRVDELEAQLAEQRALIEAVAADRGIDADAILAGAAAEQSPDDGGTSRTDADAPDAADEPANGE